MMFATHRSLALALSCVVLLAFTAGCQSRDVAEGASEDASTSDSGVKSLPALHVVLAWESLLGGENWERKNYRAKLDACRGSGWPMRALSPEDEAKLGTGEVEILIDARRQFAQQVSWTLGENGDSAQTTCLIKLEQHTDQDTIEDTTGMYEPIDEDSHAQGRQDLQAGAGWKLVGEEQLKGQSCTRWRQEGRQEVCMWSGGMKWGFDDTPADVAGCTVDTAGAYLNSIPLESKPLEGGNGCILQLKSFSLSKGLIPSNVPSEEGKREEHEG